jgi:hypothetical protein
MLVVVLDVAVQNANKVLAANDQEVVQALSPDGPNPTLGNGVGIGRPDRRADDLGTGRTPDIVERSDELGVPVADQEPERGSTVIQLNHEIAGLLGHPRASRMGRDTSQVHPPAAQFDDEQHIQPPQPNSVDGEEVAGQDARRLPVQE